ncbi:uncharacterized protein LOC142796340 [Rhipicephalus microplus]|uniref:uncharacterized protein LOC142796340 n=1 Tax=Rhipicephalus microplus TaxID=6941 RepID=UPI003F6C9629
MTVDATRFQPAHTGRYQKKPGALAGISPTYTFCTIYIKADKMKYSLSFGISMIFVAASHALDDCDKTTLLIGNGMCTEGPLPIPPNEVMQLRCPCANVMCHDSMRRVTITWSDCDTMSWNTPVIPSAHDLRGTYQSFPTQEENSKRCSKRPSPGTE